MIFPSPAVKSSAPPRGVTQLWDQLWEEIKSPISRSRDRLQSAAARDAN